MAKKFAIIGNPNCGKSTIFNSLTGVQQKISNWAGVTVEKKSGIVKNTKIEIIDLPGIYSLGFEDNKSMDQNIAIKFLLKEKFDGLINVVNSTNLESNLYLTLQLLELQIPIILVLNMDDLAQKKKVIISADSLANKLHCPVIKLTGTNSNSISKLIPILKEYKPLPLQNQILDLYPTKIQDIYQELARNNKAAKPADIYHIIAGNKSDSTSRQNDYPDTDLLLVNARYEAINKLTLQKPPTQPANNNSITDILDRFCLNKIFGIPIFLSILYLFFLLSVNFGSIFGPAIDMACEATFIDLPQFLLKDLVHIKWLITLIKAVGSSICAISSLVPIIWAIYFFLAILETSGYMARAAIITSRVTAYFGLSPNSFFPIIVGLGCNVPAIMAARIINNTAQRIITIMVSPFLSCSARLSIYMLCCFIFFPKDAHIVILSLYILGFIVALLTGLLMHNRKLAKTNTYMYLPEYHLPSFRHVITSSFSRTRGFIFGAGKTIMIVFCVVNLLGQINYNFSKNDAPPTKQNLLEVVGTKITPIFEPMGLKEEAWPAAVSMVTGIMAKEIVIGTLLSLQDIKHEKKEIALDDIKAKYAESINIIIRAGNISIVAETNHAGIGGIKNIFPNSAAVLAYLIFLALYLPCSSVFITIGKEIGYRWATISAIWSTTTAYLIATIFYQIYSLVNNYTTDYNTLFYSIAPYISLCFALRLYSFKSLYMKSANK
jgi:ferrous iron transport protein B